MAKTGPKPKPIAERLRARIAVVSSGCHEWQGARDRAGYGKIDVHHRMSRRVHRVVYETFVAPIPQGLMVLHKCDNPPCCNPDHLYVGTAKDNTRDILERGQHGVKPKLSTRQVRIVRKALRYGRTAVSLAAQYGVCPSVIDDVKRGKRRYLQKIV